MRSLFWKLFGAFWLTTVVILAISIFVSFRIADEQSPYSFADPREVDEQLQTILEEEGVKGLKKYISNAGNFPRGQTVYLIDSDGSDMLNRTLPQRVERRAQRIWSVIAERGRGQRQSRRQTRRLGQSLLVTASGRKLLAMPGPAPEQRFGFLPPVSGRRMVLAIAAAVSLLSFWLLSRSLAKPVVRISETASRLAAGDMTSRVGEDAYTNDEIGELARQFDKMAGELDQQSRSRLEMFRNIAHELRAPLTRLHIAADLLDRKPDSAQQQLDRIRYEIERVESLAAQVLSLARAEQLQEATQRSSLTQVLDQVIDDATFEAKARDVQIHYRNDVADIDVLGPADAIASAIENVVRNALQHTPASGEVVVTMQAGVMATVTVSDSGSGVRAEDLDKIFEPFFRIDTNRPGAGIGLAITQRVLQKLGGALAASNGASGGLCVTMQFPLADNRSG
ncbi:MAG: HAMP domain-containing sensor histidine kinase [Pseudomonadota bacterium]